MLPTYYHGDTITIEASDAVQDLTAYFPQTLYGLMISVEDYDIRYTTGPNSSPSRTTPLGHILGANTWVAFIGHRTVRTFKFTNKTEGDNAVLQITPLVLS
jgi:hypothetical protein